MYATRSSLAFAARWLSDGRSAASGRRMALAVPSAALASRIAALRSAWITWAEPIIDVSAPSLRVPFAAIRQRVGTAEVSGHASEMDVNGVPLSDSGDKDQDKVSPPR